MKVDFILVASRRLSLLFTAEEAQKAIKGLEENIIHTKYIELVCFICLKLSSGFFFANNPRSI